MKPRWLGRLEEFSPRRLWCWLRRAHQPRVGARIAVQDVELTRRVIAYDHCYGCGSSMYVAVSRDLGERDGWPDEAFKTHLINQLDWSPFR